MTRCRAFTLIELLVTVSIISVLVAIMVPTLRSARDGAHKTVCASNIRQLQLANDLFAPDNLEQYAPGAARFIQNLDRWHGRRAHANESFGSDGALTSYLGESGSSAQVRACPSFRPQLQELRARGSGFEAGAGGYGYNNVYVGVQRARDSIGVWRIRADEDGSKRSAFATPVRTVAFTDAALAHRDGDAGVVEYSFVEPRFWPEAPGAQTDPSAHFRHSGSANVVWLDGHVSGETRVKTWSSGYYSDDAEGAMVGWFGADDDNRLFDYD